MRIGAGLDIRLGLGFDGLREAGREAARLGFESLWTPDLGVPGAFHVCAAWSQDTPLPTGISVVPAARLWNPVALAMQAATVGEISQGRFVLGIGTGGYGARFWASVGLPDRPIAVMRDYLTVLRGLLAGETVTHEGPALRVHGASLGARDLPRVPVYLGALGRQMLRLAGEQADGALLNWATPDRIAASRALVADGAARVGRDPGEVPLTMYIRVCVDDDVDAARRALGAQVLGYAMAGPGMPLTAGYRGLFTEMGFGDVLSELERRRLGGEPMPSLIDAAPDDLLTSVGYFGPASGAAPAYARLSRGLDETVVRILTARPGLEPVVAALEALTPARIRAALPQTRPWVKLRAAGFRPSRRRRLAGPGGESPYGASPSFETPDRGGPRVVPLGVLSWTGRGAAARGAAARRGPACRAAGQRRSHRSAEGSYSWP